MKPINRRHMVGGALGLAILSVSGFRAKRAMASDGSAATQGLCDRAYFEVTEFADTKEIRRRMVTVNYNKKKPEMLQANLRTVVFSTALQECDAFTGEQILDEGVGSEGVGSADLSREKVLENIP